MIEKGERLEVDAATQTLLERYLLAWEIEDVPGLVALMKEDEPLLCRRLLPGILDERRFGQY